MGQETPLPVASVKAWPGGRGWWRETRMPDKWAGVQEQREKLMETCSASLGIDSRTGTGLSFQGAREGSGRGYEL